MLVSPLLVACLHQDQLNGKRERPMSLDDLAEALSEAFVRAYSRQPSVSAAPHNG
jgi:hypothetical protein